MLWNRVPCRTREKEWERRKKEKGCTNKLISRSCRERIFSLWTTIIALPAPRFRGNAKHCHVTGRIHYLQSRVSRNSSLPFSFLFFNPSRLEPIGTEWNCESVCVSFCRHDNDPKTFDIFLNSIFFSLSKFSFLIFQTSRLDHFFNPIDSIIIKKN